MAVDRYCEGGRKAFQYRTTKALRLNGSVGLAMYFTVGLWFVKTHEHIHARARNVQFFILFSHTSKVLLHFISFMLTFCRNAFAGDNL